VVKKSKLSCNRRGFTFSEKKTEIGDKKKKVEKKGEPVTFGLRGCPEVIFFRAQKHKTHLSCPKKARKYSTPTRGAKVKDMHEKNLSRSKEDFHEGNHDCKSSESPE
jgi:hypothetical protein